MQKSGFVQNMSENYKMPVKQNIKDRLSSNTVGDKCKKIRNTCVILSNVALLLVSPMCPITLGVTAVKWITFSGAMLGIVAGGAHMDKSKK